MDKEYKFSNITDTQLKQKGVQALADRPNAAQQYGQSALSPTQLKKWFDNLAILLAEKINEIQSAIQSEDATKYIGLNLAEYKTLDALIEAMGSGKFAEDALMLLPNENSVSPQPLQRVIFDIFQSYSDSEERISNLENDKLSQVVEQSDSVQLYGVSSTGEQTMYKAGAAPGRAQVPMYGSNGELYAKMQDIPGMESPGGQGYEISPVVNLKFFEELRKHIGAGVRFSMDPETYIITIEVLNISGDVIYRTGLDLPLEEVVVGGAYSDGYIILTLKNGGKVEIPVSKLVNGLVTNEQHRKDIQDLNDKVDASLNAYIVDVYQLVGGDYVDYS
jgi:hypothetical protein